MIVLSDMQWIELPGGIMSATQLSALRVDENWEIVSEFHTMIRPMNPCFHRWSYNA